MLNQIQIKKTWQQFCVEALPSPGLCWGKSLSTFLKFCSGLTDQDHRVAVEKSFFLFSGFNRLTPQCHQCHQNPNHGMNAHNWKQLKAKQRITSQCNASKCISPVPQFSHVCTWVYPCQEPGLGCLENTRSLLGQKNLHFWGFLEGANRSRTEFTVAKQLRSFPLCQGSGLWCLENTSMWRAAHEDEEQWCPARAAEKNPLRHDTRCLSINFIMLQSGINVWR